MPLPELTPELKSVFMFSGAGIAVGGVSPILGAAYISGASGIAILMGLRKLAMKTLGMEATELMQFGVMPYLTFWYAVWVILINV